MEGFYYERKNNQEKGLLKIFKKTHDLNPHVLIQYINTMD